MQFEWDKEKAASNLKKHAVSFEEASSVFGDLSAKMFFDEEHSGDEIREFHHRLFGSKSVIDC